MVTFGLDCQQKLNSKTQPITFSNQDDVRIFLGEYLNACTAVLIRLLVYVVIATQLQLKAEVNGI